MIDVIIPVYDGLEETRRCIASVLDNKNCTPFNLLVIEDCSPNPAIRVYLQELASAGKIELLVNEVNRGFVGTVNRGMSLHPERDVLLLNSDTQVANDWLDRMLRHASEDATIATITPFSNNAEICSFPRYCQPNPLWEGKTVAEVDAVFASLPAHHIDVPTGVGFCMYVRRAALDAVGLFDEKTFGRGYGEENDFCMRVAACGWRNVTCTNVFVFHDGGVSFSTEKAARVQHAMEVLDKKYPQYHRLVHEHLQKDPERPYRVLAQLKLLLQSQKRKYLFVAHRLGGGVIKHLQELADYVATDVDVLFLKPGDEGGVQLCCEYGGYHWSLYFDLEAEYPALLELLQSIGIERAHLHHVMEVGDAVFDLLKDLSIPFDVTLHDYYFVNANPTLINKDGVFAEHVDTRDAQCAESYPVPAGLSAQAWREKYAAILTTAARIFAPSARCRDVYLEYFPDLPIEVAYHPEWEQSHPYAVPHVPTLGSADKLRVLVVGAMSREKGADVLEKTATYRDPLGRLEYHLLGYAYRPLAPEVIQHGPYEDGKLDALIAGLQPHLIWFPAQWHETYCYTLSAALRSGLPILATDLGSFPERLEGRPLSYIKPWRTSPIEWNDTLLQIRDWLLSNQAYNEESPGWSQLPVLEREFLYSRDYVVIENNADRAASDVSGLPAFDRLCVWCYPHHVTTGSQLSAREKSLSLLFRLRELPGMHLVLRLVPFEWQRAIKRWFSHRPVHEIVNEQKRM
ncbi:MAG TPA: glycosyltransferase [Pseudomonadales bacterium]|nr:glycosyltransferase [Pseudomonadales bacterium]